MKSKIIRRITSLLISAIVTLSFAAVPMLSASAFDNNVKSGTVAVVFFLKGAKLALYDGENLSLYSDLGDIEWSGGSGFFVGRPGDKAQYIVTNEHVVDDYIAANEGEQYVLFTGQYTSDYSQALYLISDSCEMRIYYSQDDYDVAYVDCYGDMQKVDLAVLRLREPTEKRHTLKLMAPTEAMVGSTVYTIGYPGNADNSFTSASKYGINDATVHKGIISKLVANEGKGVERIAIDAVVQHGNSGGPLVNEAGYVLGVNTNVESNSPYENQIETDYYSISTTEIMRFLDKNNIPYETAGGFNGVILAIVLVVVGVVVVAVIAVVLLLVMKKPAKAPAGAMPAGAMPAGGMPMGGYNNGMGANNMPVVKGGIIRSLSAQHSGKVFPVGKAPVTIGRDASSCVIVYQEGTPGVSRKHCTVSYVSETREFILTDLNSSYGTFILTSGERLTANQPIKLKPGECFYVGDKGNVLSVELEK